jgi:serpin B
MVRKGKYTLHEQDDAQVLSLPYKGNELSMWVALPRAADGLPALEKSLTASRFEDWAKAAKPVNDLLVYLPKFKIEVRYPLNRHLIKLGMGDAFSDIKADFRGMHSGDKELYLSLVVHKAFVEVNEEGTEAAAATGAVMKLRSAPAKPKLFRADHPFLFAIRHNASGAILFQGRMGQV